LKRLNRSRAKLVVVTGEEDLAVATPVAMETFAYGRSSGAGAGRDRLSDSLSSMSHWPGWLILLLVVGCQSAPAPVVPTQKPQPQQTDAPESDPALAEMTMEDPDAKIAQIADEIAKRLGHLPQFRDFVPAKAIMFTTIKYEHRVRQKPNPNYESQRANKPRGGWRAAVPVPETVPAFPFEDSILLRLTFVDPDSQYGKQRAWGPHLRLYGWPVEILLDGPPSPELTEIGHQIDAILEDAGAAGP
jgi:hypothetical protein